MFDSCSQEFLPKSTCKQILIEWLSLRTVCFYGVITKEVKKTLAFIIILLLCSLIRIPSDIMDAIYSIAFAFITTDSHSRLPISRRVNDAVNQALFISSAVSTFVLSNRTGRRRRPNRSRGVPVTTTILGKRKRTRTKRTKNNWARERLSYERNYTPRFGHVKYSVKH